MRTPLTTTWARIAFGYFLASLVPAVIFALATPLQAGQFSGWQLGLIPVFFVFSAVAVALIGLPMYFALRAMRLITWWSSLIAGCLGGALVSLVLHLPSAPSPSNFLVDCPVGAASAFVFWLTLRVGSRT